MKKILLLIAFAVSLFNIAQGQVKGNMGAYATISGVSLVSGVTYNFTVTGFVGNLKARGEDSYMTTDVSVGDVIWTVDCNRFVIATITSNTGITMVGTMTNTDAAQSAPANGSRIALLREITTNNFTTYSLPPAGDGNSGAIAGISINVAACIQSHYRRQDSIAFANISGGGTTETASNGLTKTGNDIQLGGTLTGNTTITGANTVGLIINNLTTAQLYSKLGTTTSGFEADSNATTMTLFNTADASKGGTSQVGKDSVYFTKGAGSSQTAVVLLNDSIKLRGLQNSNGASIDSLVTISAATGALTRRNANTVVQRNNPFVSQVPTKNGLTAITTDSLVTVNATTGEVGKIDMATISGSATNGLTKSGSNTVLGGALTSATTVTTGVTNTLSIAGLQGTAGVLTDSVMMVTNAGALKKRDVETIGKDFDVSAGLSGTTTKEYYTNLTDTTSFRKLATGVYEILNIVAYTPPVDTVVGTNTYKVTKNTIWNNISISTVSGEIVKYNYQNNKFSPITPLTVENFGAKTLTSSADALIKSLTYNSVIVGKGIYNIEKRITITQDSFQLIGDDNKKSILKWTGGFDKMIVIKAKQIVFKNIVFDFNYTEMKGQGVFIGDSSIVKFENCEFKNIVGTHTNGFYSETNNQYAVQSTKKAVSIDFLNCDFKNITNTNLTNQVGTGFCGAYLSLDSTFVDVASNSIAHINFLKCRFDNIQTILNAGLTEANKIDYDDADAIRFYSENLDNVYSNIDNCTFKNISKRAVKNSDVIGVNIANCDVIEDNLPYKMTTVIKLGQGTNVNNIKVKTVQGVYSMFQSHSSSNINVSNIKIDKCDYFYQLTPTGATPAIRNVSVSNVVVDSLIVAFNQQSIGVDTLKNLSYDNIKVTGGAITARGFDGNFQTSGNAQYTCSRFDFKNTHLKFSAGGVIKDINLMIDNALFTGFSTLSLVENNSDYTTNLNIKIKNIATGFKTASRFFYYQYGNNKSNNMTIENNQLWATNTNYDAAFNSQDGGATNVRYIGNGRIMLGNFNNANSQKRNLYDNIYRLQTVTPTVAFVDCYRLDSSEIKNITDYSDYASNYVVSFASTTNYNKYLNINGRQTTKVSNAGNVNKPLYYLTDTSTVKLFGINITGTPAYKLDIDANTGSTGNPIRLQGLLAGSTTDSLVSSASGVLKRLSIAEVVNGNTIKLSNQSVAIPTIATGIGGQDSVNVTVTGAVVGNTVIVNPRGSIITANVGIDAYYVSNANVVTIVFSSRIVGSAGGVSRNFDIKVDKN